MKIVILKMLLFVSFFAVAQKNEGNLLLLKIERIKNIKFEKNEFFYLVIELDSLYQLKIDENLSKPVFFINLLILISNHVF